jgi:hypothetical protein
VTIDDPKVFIAPWTPRVTYRRVTTEWEESVCVENPTAHYEGEWIGLPRADHPDFSTIGRSRQLAPGRIATEELLHHQ